MDLSVQTTKPFGSMSNERSKVQGLGFRDQGLGCRVWDLGFRI